MSWKKVLRLLVVNRLLEHSSESPLHRHWFVKSGMDVLLEEGFAGQATADDVDQVGGEVGEIAEGFVLDLGAGAEGAAEEVGLIEFALVCS